MPPHRLPPDATLQDWVREHASSSDWLLCGTQQSVSVKGLAAGSSFGGRLAELAGRSVLVATVDQLAAAVALIELDGLARRLTLCPPDVAIEHLPAIIANAEVDAIVSDRAIRAHAALGVDLHVLCRPEIRPSGDTPYRWCRTQWILLTSGTTGAPKAVQHSLASLTAAIRPRGEAEARITWATFYDIRRYGGLQIFLRAIIGGAPLVLTDGKEPIGQFLSRLGEHGATHVTGTPSHWRRALWSPAVGSIAPRYVRMSGEIADQAILDHLHAVYPHARIGHAYASTEAGVGFEVDDGREGFPLRFLEKSRNGVEMKIQGGSLRIRSAGTATRYLGENGGALADADGFVDTGDVIAVRNERCYFAGRTGGIINVGGLKVHPEEVEAVINRHPAVHISLVRPKKNPITGSVVVADVVLAQAFSDGVAEARKSEVKSEILALCRGRLAQHKVPVVISFVPKLAVADSGKLARHHA